MRRLPRTACRLILLLLLFASLNSLRAWAQASFTAQVRGVVQDSSNAVVPKAAVTLINEGTQVATKTTTDEMGRYLFNGLAPASYTAKVKAF